MYVSVIDLAFKVFVENSENEKSRRCRIGKIKIGKKSINPDIFRHKSDKSKGVWQ